MSPERSARIQEVLANRQEGLTVLLENVHDPHNVSAIMRSCDAVGIQDVFVLTTSQPPPKRYGHKSSGSAAHWLSVHTYTDVDACFADLRHHADHIYATHLSTDSHQLYELDLKGRVALVFGNEQHGISPGCLERCDGNFIIPQVGMVKSLNVSVACAVSLYEAFRQRQAAGLYEGGNGMPEDRRAALTERWSMKRERN